MDKRINPLELNTNEEVTVKAEKVSKQVSETKAENVKPNAEKTSSVKWYVKVKNALAKACVATGKFFVKIWIIVKNFFVNLFNKIFKKPKKVTTTEKTEENKESK